MWLQPSSSRAVRSLLEAFSIDGHQELTPCVGTAAVSIRVFGPSLWSAYSWKASPGL